MCYIGGKLLNMGSRLIDYEDTLKELWGLNKESQREDFFDLFETVPEVVKFIFCASARVG